MTPDQWFAFWMTTLQIVGGGILALGGVWLGMRHSDKRHREELAQGRADRLRELQREADERQRMVLQEWLDLTMATIDAIRRPVTESATRDEKVIDTRDAFVSRWFLRQPQKGTDEHDLIWPVFRAVTQWAMDRENIDGHRDIEVVNAIVLLANNMRGRIRALEARVVAA